MATFPFMPAPGVAQLVIQGDTLSGDPSQNTLAFRKNDLTSWGSSEVQGLVDSFDTWLGAAGGIAAYRQNMQSSLAIRQLKARDLSVDGGAEYSKTVDHAGVDGGTCIASGLSFAITLRTGLVGRSFRGRVFLYGFTSAITSGDADHVDTTKADAIAAGWASLITAAAGWSPAMKWVVVSRYHKVGSTPSVRRDSAVSTPIVSTGYSNPVMDYQRRRAPFHARHM